MTEEEINARLDEWLQPGVSLRVYYGPDNPFNGVLHIRALVDDQIVYREWSYKKQRWNYKIEIRYYFYLLLINNHLGKA